LRDFTRYGDVIAQSSAAATESAPERRRDRLRQATLAEIKSLAWAQIAESGAAALSLRGIAREMGMTSSALYRYFASRDQLLIALAGDGFTSLADALEATEAESVERSERLDERFLRTVNAYRAWSLAHPSEYALMFGTPVPGVDVDGPEVHEEMVRGVNVLFRVMITGVQSGVLQPPALTGPGAGKVRAKLRRWPAHEGEVLPPAALAACLFAWNQLHGAIALEVFGHVPAELVPADDLFDLQMRQLLATLGCPGPSRLIAAPATPTFGRRGSGASGGRACGQRGLDFGGGPAQLAGPHPAQQRLDRANNFGCRRRQVPGVVGSHFAGVDVGAGEEVGQMAELMAEPPHRVAREGRIEVAPPRLPSPEMWMVVGAVMAAGIAGHRLEQVGPPHRPVDHDGLGGVDGARQGRAVQETNLDPHPPLRSLLPGGRIRIQEVQIAGDHAHALEAPGMQHRDQASGRRHSSPARLRAGA
jgi:AcrR family transcriptional regulator